MPNLTPTLQISVAPLTFHNISTLRLNEAQIHEKRSITESSLLGARPRLLKYWNRANHKSLVHTNENDASESDAGITIACEDETLYVFRHAVRSLNVEVPSPVTYQLSGATSPKYNHRNSLGSVRSGSPSISSVNLSGGPFGITPRSRVVSSINKELVEAPKNFVDFEDEPDKLKDILKGRQPKDRSETPDGGSEHKNANSPLKITVTSTPPPKQKGSPKSRSHTPKFSSGPASPNDHNAASSKLPYQWDLQSHIIPTKPEVTGVATSATLVNDEHFLAVLRESGFLSIYSTEDGMCIASSRIDDSPQLGSVLQEREVRLDDTWKWRSLVELQVEESTFLLASASDENSTESMGNDGVPTRNTRNVVMELLVSHEHGQQEASLRKVNQWQIEGVIEGIDIFEEPDKSYSVFYVSSEGQFIVQSLQPRMTSPVSTSSLEPEHHQTPLSALQLPNPFKNLKSHSVDHLVPVPAKQEPIKMVLLDKYAVGNLLSSPLPKGLSTRRREDGKLIGFAWSSLEFTIFDYQGKVLNVLCRSSGTDIEGAKWLSDDTYVLFLKNRIEFYRLKLVDANNDEILEKGNDSDPTHLFSPNLCRSVEIGPYDAIDFASDQIVFIKTTHDKKRQLLSFSTSFENIESGTCRTLWISGCPDSVVDPKIYLTSTLPLDLDTMIHGFSDGHIRQYSLTQMCMKPDKMPLTTSASSKTSDIALKGYITGLHLVQNIRTKEKFIVGGADDGTVAFWSNSNFNLCARRIIFTTPLAKVIQFHDVDTGPMHGCILCISRDGTIAVVAVDGFQFQYLIPGSSALLRRVCLGGNNLLLIYADLRARLWDVQTHEFWRSMSVDKAEELLNQGGWSVLSLEDDTCTPSSLWKPIANLIEGCDVASTLSLDLERFVADSITVTKMISTNRDQTRTILQTLERLRLILSTLLTPGLSPDVDSICTGNLGIQPSSVTFGFSSNTTTILYDIVRPQDHWCISGNVTAARALSIIIILRAMGLFEELLEGATAVISFYSTSISSCVGPNFKPPSLAYLGRRWFDSSNEIRQAIRTLFDAAVARMSDEEATLTAEQWQHHVPFLQPTAERETTTSALALFICGYIAAEKYSLLSTNALTDISKSISLYLHDEKSSYRVLAIDLCSRGFHVWQHYIDAMEILRALFTLATTSRKDSISIQNIGTQARAAVLNIATENTTLFMTTLCLDILTPTSLDHRKAVMQVVAFLIRKRPQVLQPNLPKLMEAVVKSLDPNATANRDAVIDAATEVIGQVVKTFLTVDFHMSSQRIAVGSNEGAVVMYDLKTATRLYVLEGHMKEITACSFSPDGRRLITLSMPESAVLVWKVGSSFTSFFNPGAPPRQGHGGSQPYKTLNFKVTNDGVVSTENDKVYFEWVAERSVKLKIRDNILTFST